MTQTAIRLSSVFLLALPLTALPKSAAQAVVLGTSQAESFHFSTTVGRVVDDSTAQAGKSLQFLRNGTATRSVPLRANARTLSIRVRGDACDGSPTMRVSLNGRAAGTVSVSTSVWSSVRVPVSASAGSARVDITFLNDYRSAQCDRNLYVDRVAVTTTASPRPGETRQDLVFNADFANKGLSAYASTHNANRVSVVNDPVLGAARQVARFKVYDTDDQLTGNPRAQLESAKFWTSGAEYYVGASYYFPQDWPVQQDTKQWVNLGEVYGAPYAGASPNALFAKKVSSGGQVITWQRNGTYAWDRPFEVPLVRGRWHDFVFRIKLSSDPTVGFWEGWSNTGSGWQRLKLHGQDRLYTQTIDASNNGGANYHKLAHYRSKGMWPVATHYAADHKIGTSFAAVAPRSYS